MTATKKKKSSLGEQIRQALMTQKKLAKITGINEVRLSRGMRGEVDFTEDEKRSIEEALQIKFEQ